MNKTFHSGNLTRDPESKFSKDGKQIVDFGLAVSGYGDKTIFLDVKAFGKTAELVAKHKKKGDPVIVEGRLEVDQWEKDGQKRSKTYIIADNVEFLRGGNGESSGGEKNSGAARKSSAPVPVQDEDDENSIPF